ncbi:N-acetylneuraminate synthase family protein [Crocinitomicaceae bacterium]|nr:N-acetylneuraminate synthase family protein [Crocinitomicaceae bacterium]
MQKVNRTIIEVANTHGGDFDYMISLIDEFERIQPSGIKFQPLKYDQIAVKDYEWYPVYEKLYFTPIQWKEIISRAKQTKEVWLDLFDTYGVQILKDQLENIQGIKLQTSVLNNLDILKELREIDTQGLKLIINIAGRTYEEIDHYLCYFQEQLSFDEVLIEVGFQSYPTKLVDSGISKLKMIKSKYNNKIVFADHVEGVHSDAMNLPLVAFMSGADIIEKHVMHSSLPTEYDYFSSIKINQFSRLLDNLHRYSELFNEPFINSNEKEYLEKTIQIPILNKDKSKNDIISFKDLTYKRTNLKGMNHNEIIKMINNGFVKIKKEKAQHEPIKNRDLEKVKTACIIAARLKSSRLKLKAKLKIGELSSVELCIKNCLRFDNIDQTILATSTTDEDAELSQYTYDPNVIFHKGHPDDVIQRYLDIIRKEKIDVFIRVTGDMPYVSKEIADLLLKDHLKSGADYTVGQEAAAGTNLEIINSSALEKVKKHFPSANYSEYMTWYFQNNPEHFVINKVKLPEELVRDYRLTIDYQEDLNMFNKIEEHFEINNIDFSIYELFKFLDSNPKIAKINSHLTLKYKTDKELIDTLNRETKIK